MNQLLIATVVCLLTSGPVHQAQADEGNHHVNGRHVLVLSIDGMHEFDLQVWIQNNPGSAIARLAAQGVSYPNALATKPGDSIPATVGIFTGGSPAIAGMYYDDAYHRGWFPAGSNCVSAAGPGTVISLKQDIDWDPTALDGGASAHKGQAIKPALLPMQKLGDGSCVPVFPHEMMRVNTAFEIIKRAHGLTAFAEKRPSYEFLQGPSGSGVDDLFLLEINANNALSSISLTEAFDDARVTAVLNWIDGKDHSGTKSIGVPSVFGMNFQAVNAAKKDLADSGYLSYGVMDPMLGGPAGALAHVDASIGSMLAELAKQGLTQKTAIILMAKHGESPLDPHHRNIQLINSTTAGISPILKGLGLSSASSGRLSATQYKITNKSGVLIWLGDQSKTETVAQALLTAADVPGNPLNIAQVLWGGGLQQWFPNSLVDPAPPDIVVVPNLGTNYEPSGSTTFAEHGGFNENELHVPIVVVAPDLAPGTVRSPVTTTQIAPTILVLLGLDPAQLDAARLEGISVLPGVSQTPPDHEN